MKAKPLGLRYIARQHMNSNALSRGILFAAVLAALAVGLGGLNTRLPGGGDNADYIAEAEALATRGERVHLHLHNTPEATLRPPLFPLLLSVSFKLFGRDMLALKALLALFAPAAVLAAYWALMEGLSPRARLALEKQAAVAPDPVAMQSIPFIALWFALSPTLGLCAHDVLSDVPFTCFALLAFAATGRAARVETSWRWILIASVCLVLAAGLRSAATLVALACAGGLLLEALLRKPEAGRRRCALGALALGAVALGVLAYALLTTGWYFRSAVEAPTGLASRPWSERLSLIATWYTLFLPVETIGYEHFAPVWVLGLMGLPLALLGCMELLRSGSRTLPAAWLVYQGALFFWPHVDARFYLPVLPFFAALSWIGARRMVERLAAWHSSLGILSAFGLALPAAASCAAYGFGVAKGEIRETTEVDWIAGVVLLGPILSMAFYRVLVASRRAADPRPLLVAGAVVLLTLAALRTGHQNVALERQHGPAPDGPGWADLYAATQWLKDHAAPDAVVVSAKPSLVWFWSDRRGLPLPTLTRFDEAAQPLTSTCYAIFDVLEEDRAAARYLAPVLTREKQRWTLRWEQGQTQVWERASGG